MSDRLAVYMLDVGQGDSTLVLLPDHSAVIFDCADDHVLRKVLDDWKVQVIEAFVLSHLDKDHIAGALAFLQEFTGQIKSVYLSPDRDISDEHEDAMRAKATLDYAKEQSRDEGARRRRWELYPNFRGHAPIAKGAGWEVKLVAPAYSEDIQRARDGAWEDPNRHSSILRVEAGGNVLLVGGDAPLRSWSELPAEERPASVFRIPHHGGALDDGGVPEGWDPARLYREVSAETALVSVGTNNAYGHPSPEWVRPVTGGACRLLCTQVTGRCHGSLEITNIGGKVVRDPEAIATLRERVITQHHQWTVPQYRHLTDKQREIRLGQLEVPCAGTVVVTLLLDGGIEVRPARGGRHEEVIDLWAHPLCRPPSPDV